MKFSFMINQLKAKNLIRKDYPKGPPSKLIKEVISEWIAQRVNFFLVCDEENKILGVVTLYDLLEKTIPFFLKIDSSLAAISINELINLKKLKEISQNPVSKIMTKEVVLVKENDDLMKVINLMYLYNFDYIPVVDKHNKVIGIIDRIEIEKKLIDIINS